VSNKTADIGSIPKTELRATGVSAGAPAWLRQTAHAGLNDRLEKTKLRFGIVPLTDCAPIVVAAERGYFAKYGLEVSISKEASWANIRDKVSVGALDGAQMLAGMPIAATLGIDAMPTPMVTAFSMDLNGNGITVSTALYERMRKADPRAMARRPITARALKKVVDADKKAGRGPMTFATVFPVSTHNYQLRYWLSAAGIHPDRDVRLTVIPPPQMVAHLSARNIDGFCVGEPWNERAVKAGLGRTVITSYEIWNNGPEKVFGVTREWAEMHPNTHRAVIAALLDAARWIDEPENRVEVAKIISSRAYINVPEEIVRMSMTGTFQYTKEELPQALPDFNVFHRYAATFPWRSHAEWFITQMLRWGQIAQPIDICQTAAAVYRSDIYRESAQALGVPVPHIDYKTEGAHGEPWSLDTATTAIAMGPDRFFDGRVFDPAMPLAYLAGFDIRSNGIPIAALAEVNERAAG